MIGIDLRAWMDERGKPIAARFRLAVPIASEPVHLVMADRAEQCACTKTRADADPMVTPDIGNMANLYLQGADPKNPLASPNFANLQSLPPLLIHVGRDEVLLDDSIKLDQKATADGVDSTLEIWEDMIHVWHAFHPMLPEGKQAIARVGSFLRERWAAA